MTTPISRRSTAIDIHIGERIRQLRLDRDMTQAQLGERLGVSFGQVRKYEYGIDRIGAARLFAVAKVFRVPVTHFFEGLR